MQKVTIVMEQFGIIEVNPMILDPNYRENFLRKDEPVLDNEPKIIVGKPKYIPKSGKFWDQF